MFRSLFRAATPALLSLLLGLAGTLYADSVLMAAEHGVHPGSEDAGPALRALLQNVRTRDGNEPCTIQLTPGEYHFYADTAAVHKLHISNHDQQPEHPVGIPLVGLNNVRLEGRDCHFVFHGRMLPVLVMDSQNISLRGFSIRYATPFSAEGHIISQDDEGTMVEMHPDSSWSVENGRFHNVGEGWKKEIRAAIAFKPDGRMVPTGRNGDIIWSSRACKLASNRVCFAQESRSLGLSEGDVLVFRSYWRPTPAVLLYRALNTSLQEVVFHDSMGMGLLAQRSDGISIRGGGCIRREGRYATTGADATHFSNCRGHINITNALYEGMMDDAINVHATCLAITAVPSPCRIVARYMHPQAVGFEVMQPGERLRFIHGPTLENNPQEIAVKSVEQPDERTLHITLESPLPEGIGVGDALENTNWHPRVTFSHNTVRHNRARGSLFTTPEPVLVEHNQFLWSSGSAILLAGDAQGWYESGSCQDVTIRHNIFDHNLTSLFQFTDAVIAICPEVKQPHKQKKRYHRNIRVEDNTFLTHRVPLLSAISAENLVFRNNKVVYDEAAPALFGEDCEPGLIHPEYCENVDLQEIPTAE